MHRRILIILAVIAYGKSQTKDGDSCVDQFTNTVGRCTSADTCESARRDFQQNGIRPTFCTYSAFGTTLVCCRDGSNILQTADAKPMRPVWGSASNKQSDSRRVSERKCEEYSRGVVEKVDFIPLLPDPETMSISAAKCDYTGVELIVGGENANQGEFPHMAAIGWANFEGGYDFNCGGSLISSKYVLTAGHCTQNPRAQNPVPSIVRLGDQNIDPSVIDGANPIEVPIKKTISHPDYKPPGKYNDIALFELASDVTFSATIRPACLWSRNDMSGLRKALATGWGVTDTATRQTSKELQKVSLSLLQNSQCDQLLLSSRNRHWAGFRDTQMCAGELRGGKDTCQGDSGSPLQVTSRDNQCIFNIIGITSFGRKCAESGMPAIYTRVSSYVDWIESVVWPGE
ncbi:unnamed protein product [Chilo suppressalis]|uniref:Peptidase S1 domain-containing protein n=2 Tax=Chilo suppressalis TaxID=168631 RepID=A0ABN8LAE7_CHISP|nr:hypothetical protein evm_000264 [Chilo suppressalis]CAH2987898.1 unnamed protein product [Chilo suppressalis]